MRKTPFRLRSPDESPMAAADMAPTPARVSALLLALTLRAIEPAAAQGPPTGEASLIETENDVSAKRAGASWQKAAPTLPLATGDQVKTGKKSRAAVRLTDLSVMRLDQLSVFEVGSVR